MKFEDMKEFPHEDKLRALHGDKNWRVYFPNGYGVDIVGGPQNLEPFTLPNGKPIRIDFLYGDGINTFEVAKFEHNINTNKPVQLSFDEISYHCSHCSHKLSLHHECGNYDVLVCNNDNCKFYIINIWNTWNISGFHSCHVW